MIGYLFREHYWRLVGGGDKSASVLSESKSPNLLERIESFSLDEPDAALPFTARLAREQGWSHAFAARVVREYRRFVYLAMTAGHAVTPSEEVDQAWHLHLVYTRSYWQKFCGEVLGRELHHEPTTGGARESGKFVNWYSKTLDSYQTTFGEPAPREIWPAPAERFAGASELLWISRSKYRLIPRPSFSRLRFWKKIHPPRS